MRRQVLEGDAIQMTRAGTWGRPALAAAILLPGVLGAATDARAALGFHAPPAVVDTCKLCHNTASGDPRLRGWAAPIPAAPGDWAGKPISALCYSCHESGGGGFGASDMTNNAFAPTSHDFVVADAPREPEGSPQGTFYPAIALGTLPYAARPEIECTTCHNIHQDVNRPFLQRPSIDALCDACHQGRANGASLDTVPGATRPYSTHPTGQALADTATANIKDLAAVDPALKTPTPAGAPWSLGGHLGDPGGDTGVMDCRTCHAVHGPVQDTPGRQDLLAIDNATPAGTPTPSRLCEGCHFGGDAGEQVGTLAQSGLAAGEYSDHPIDALANRAFYPTGVALPASWLEGTTPNGDRGAQPFYQPLAGTASPVCSSCHDAHGGITGTPLLRGPLPGDVWAPFDSTAWCYSCHAGAQVLPAAHHSNTSNLAVALGDAVDSQLACGDCHGPAGTTDWRAHNGFWAWPVAVADADSAFCLACHAGSDPTDLVAPALKGQTFAEPAAFPATHGTARGTASHYLGPDSDEFAGVVPKLTAWSSGFFSAYGPPNTGGGGGAPPLGPGEIICESCHSVLFNDGAANPAAYTSPEKAGWESNLLLEPYEDDSPGAGDGSGAGAVGSALCTGCHTPAGNHHPMTGDVVPLTGLPLRTGAGSLADAPGAPGTLSYPNVDALDCDSCHRPHRADADSDVAAAAHGASTSGDGRPTRHILEVDGAAHRYSDLCAECHAR